MNEDQEYGEHEAAGASGAVTPEQLAADAAAAASAALVRAAIRQAPRPAPLGPAARARARRTASAAAARRREAADTGESPADRVREGLRRAGERYADGTDPEDAPEAVAARADRPRPADAARAALRGSRRGAAPGDEVTSPGRPASPPAAGTDGPVPGEPKGEEPAESAEPAPAPAAPPPAVEPPRPRSAPAPAARPADLARAALRSARARSPQPGPETPRSTPEPRTSTSTPTTPQAPASAAAPAETAARPARPAPVPASAAAPAAARRTYRPDSATRAEAPATPWSEGWERSLTALAAEPGRFARAREYERQGRVGTVTLTPGTALAYVRGGRARPYRVSLRTHQLPEPAWERLTDACAARADRLAALLDGGLPGALAGAEGAALLPSPGEPLLDCACPDPVRPCKHGLALALRVGGLLAADPQALLLLRGRDPGTFTSELSRRHARLAARGDAGATALPGVKAGELYGREPGPLPPPLPVPATTEPPPAYPAGASAPDPLVLDRLASDAGTRALALLRTGADPLAGRGVWEDAVRIAAAHPGTGLTGTGRALYTRLARGAGAEAGALHRAVAAWRGAGAAGLRALEDPPWNPPAGPFDRARSLLLAAGHPPYRPHDNRLTSPDGTRQLRMDREGTWYAYESEPGAEDWWPRGTAAKDPVVALESAEPEPDEEEDRPDPYA
ncbi:SWIM zinc finger family protein [Streptomyces sp. P6-2-1]|uniref:SWIM zinc finger family protein n=1 Tax=Streptomyces sp. P6-2-1 TaxID=3422591 RepID=UPI003D36E380